MKKKRDRKEGRVKREEERGKKVIKGIHIHITENKDRQMSEQQTWKGWIYTKNKNNRGRGEGRRGET